MRGAERRLKAGLILGMMLTAVICAAEIFLDSIYIILIGITTEGVLMYSLYLCRRQKITEEEQKMRIQEERNKDLYWFKRMLAHNIRMPLSIMLGYGDYLLKYGDLQKQNKGYMEKIYENMLYLKVNISQALDQEEVVYQFQSCDLTTCVNEVVGYVRNAAQKAGITITVHAVQGIMLCMDKLQMIRLLYNLFENSIKYMGRAGEVYISVSCTKSQIYLVYQDNGVGMKEETIQHIFEKGYRGEEGKQGEGLGMYFVEHVVKAHCGTIRVESKMEQGVTISICFPVSVQPESLANL